MTKLFYRFSLIFCFFYGPVALAQINVPQDPSLLRANQFFNATIGDQARLYNGREYNFYFGLEGMAYFQSRLFDEKAQVVFDGVYYERIPLIFDLFKQKLITLLPSPIIKMELAMERVKSFTLYQHAFIHTELTVINRDNEKVTGFFDQIYLGKTKIFVKRTKRVHETVGTQAMKKYFTDKNFFFLQLKDKIYEFNGESNFFALFGERKNDLKKYLKQQKVKFRDDPEQAMVMVAAYYDKSFS
ncbi:MAG: hypothetical protein REI78_03610 [Pedobacter sp.]|nr:hypothetical protein [Pedobacter sp.]MDQ8052082.1 hypothetical protein [Pedobacter sp.]